MYIFCIHVFSLILVYILILDSLTCKSWIKHIYFKHEMSCILHSRLVLQRATILLAVNTFFRSQPVASLFTVMPKTETITANQALPGKM